jgi:inosine/xanthosine triphosphate pyrophosphatase family protein
LIAWIASVEQADCEGGRDQQQERAIKRMQAEANRKAAFDCAVS